MTDPWSTPPAAPGGQPAPPPPPPPAYGYGWGPGLPGTVRPTGTALLLFVVTFGIYGYVYNYKVHDEMKRYSGRGLGGGIALLLTFVANVAMPFLTPHEVGQLYAQQRRKPPVSAWTGLWVIVPSVLGYVGFFAVLLSTSSTRDTAEDFPVAALVIALLLFIGAAVTGGVIWFVKTNGALNALWRQVR